MPKLPLIKQRGTANIVKDGDKIAGIYCPPQLPLMQPPCLPPELRGVPFAERAAWLTTLIQEREEQGSLSGTPNHIPVLDALSEAGDRWRAAVPVNMRSAIRSLELVVHHTDY